MQSTTTDPHRGDQLGDAYEDAAPDERRSAVLPVIKARGYRAVASEPPHSGPVVLRVVA